MDIPESHKPRFLEEDENAVMVEVNSDRSALLHMKKAHEGPDDEAGGPTYSTHSRVSKIHHRGADDEMKCLASPARKQAVYADVNDIKENMLEAVMSQDFDIRVLYKHRGIWQHLARNPDFERVTLALIALNAVWIAVDTDHNESELLLEAHWVFQLAENLFCFFFTFEYLVRAMAFRSIRFGIYDSWFFFDGIMCGLMVAETWVFMSLLVIMGKDAGIGTGNTGGGSDLLKAARLLRLSRMLRMVRLMKAVPELLIMSKGLAAAFRPVFFTLVLMGGIVLVFAIAFTQLTHGYKLHDRYFSSIMDSSYFLLVHGALLLSTDLKAPEIYAECGLMLNLVFFLFVLLTAVLLMNMLIGVLCEVVIVVNATEKERFLVTFVKQRLQEVVALIDEDRGGTISRDEFMLIMDNASAVEAIDEVGVDVIALLDFADVIFGEEGEDGSEAGSEGSGGVELTLQDLMEVILQLRGSNQATVKDYVDVRSSVTTIFEGQFKQLDSMSQMVQDLSTQLDLTTSAMFENEECLMPGEYLPSMREFGEVLVDAEEEVALGGKKQQLSVLEENSTMEPPFAEGANDELEPEDEMVWQSGSSLAATVYEESDSEAKAAPLEEKGAPPRPKLQKSESIKNLAELTNKLFLQRTSKRVLSAGQKMLKKVSLVMQKRKSNRS
eukprot:TRINITY_DN37152_c0_g2_i5.p1 TRINITY_DN37152_c0_g2~~TRINITY_DN37152_c0_g2_i5.p1  ORF type:complete len:666 (+),score=190.26 TRINITY_DN37152_c0_g2_i5:171-2168(+)